MLGDAAERVLTDPELQLRLHVGSGTEGSVVVVGNGQVTSLAESTGEATATLAEGGGAIELRVPMTASGDLSALAVVASRTCGDRTLEYPTDRPGLNIFGCHWKNGHGGGKRPKQTEEFFVTGPMVVMPFGVPMPQILDLGYKEYDPRPDETHGNTDGTNPPNEPSLDLYRAFPKHAGPFTYYEYSHGLGIVKRAVFDIDGPDGPIPPEFDGYIGFCPYNPGHNTQVMTSSGAQWTSTMHNPGNNVERVVYRLARNDAGDWVVHYVRQAQNAEGDWEDMAGTEVTAPPWTTVKDIPKP